MNPVELPMTLNPALSTLLFAALFYIILALAITLSLGWSLSLITRRYPQVLGLPGLWRRVEEVEPPLDPLIKGLLEAEGGDGYRDSIIHAYQSFREDYMKAFDPEIPPGMTEREIIYRLISTYRLEGVKEDILNLYLLYEQARFSDHPLERRDAERCIALLKGIYRDRRLRRLQSWEGSR